MTVPNILTLVRILLTPVLIWLLLDSRLNEALIVFIVAGLTDGLDGVIARVFHQKSQLGAYLDPLADKLLLVSSFLLLGHFDLVPYWLVIITVSRDAIITLGVLTLMFHQVRVEVKPIFLSKVTTLCQLLTVLIVLASSLLGLPWWLYLALFAATAALTVASGLQYMFIGISLFDNSKGSEDSR